MSERRSTAAIIRARNHANTLRATLESVELTLRQAESMGVPPGSDIQQTVMLSAFNLANELARLDVYLRTENDAARKEVQELCSTQAQGAVDDLRKSLQKRQESKKK